MDSVQKLKKYLENASSELKRIKRKFRDEKNQMIAEAAQNGDYYLLAKRIVEHMGSDNNVWMFKFSRFEGLTRDNLHDVLEVVNSLVDDRDVQNADQWTDVQVVPASHTSQSHYVREMSFRFKGKSFRLWSPSVDVLTYFGIEDTWRTLPSVDRGDCFGVETRYRFELETFDTRDKDRVFLVSTPKETEEPKTKRHKPLEA
jgi:hypothetical protein